MKTKRIKGQKQLGWNQYGPPKEVFSVPNTEYLEPPECPDILTGAARDYYLRHVPALCRDRILGTNTWQFFLVLCSAWGDFEKWNELCQRLENAEPETLGLVTVELGKLAISTVQREKQKAQAHYCKIHAAFFRLAKLAFGVKKEDDDDGWGDD